MAVFSGKRHKFQSWSSNFHISYWLKRHFWDLRAEYASFVSTSHAKQKDAMTTKKAYFRDSSVYADWYLQSLALPVVTSIIDFIVFIALCLQYTHWYSRNPLFLFNWFLRLNKCTKWDTLPGCLMISGLDIRFSSQKSPAALFIPHLTQFSLK